MATPNSVNAFGWMLRKKLKKKKKKDTKSLAAKHHFQIL